MEVFENDGYRDVRGALVAAKLGREQVEQGTVSLAAARKEIFGNLLYERDGSVEVRDKPVFYLFKVVLYEVYGLVY